MKVAGQPNLAHCEFDLVDLLACLSNAKVALSWTEDRATMGIDPSADPEAETKARGGRRESFFRQPFGSAPKR
jgi:hypothetical protein